VHGGAMPYDESLLFINVFDENVFQNPHFCEKTIMHHCLQKVKKATVISLSIQQNN
jgi:hypothetical protein